MKHLVEKIVSKQYDDANDLLNEEMATIVRRKLNEMKKACAARMEQNTHDERMRRLRMDVLEDEDMDAKLNKQSNMQEDEQIDEARIAVVKARIRGGKIQRRKKVSNVPGMTLRGGQLVRMSPAERRARKMGAKKAARKSRQKQAQAMRKRKLSLMKRKRLGI